MAAIIGTKTDDVLVGKTGESNVIVGGKGNDKLTAGDKGDLLIGGGATGEKAVALDKMMIHQDVNAHVHFDASTAGYHNTVGMYVYDDSGKIVSTQIMFNNVSYEGTNGQTDFNMQLKAGQHIGFFVAPNAASYQDIAGLVKEGGTFHLVNEADGQPANVNAGQPMQLAYQGPNNGDWSTIHTAFWTSLVTTNTNDNKDGLQHAKITTDPKTGQMHVAFEDVLGGGDLNFNDANFTIDIGKANAALMARDHTAGHSGAGNDDILVGGKGDDTLIGGAGNDKLYGNEGNDKLHGGSGDDVLAGGTGHNEIHGGSGNDRIIAGGGNDNVVGGSGFDTIDFSGASKGVNVDLNKHVASGFGNDTIWGVEGIKGSAFDDVLTGDKTANIINGGAGNDTIHGGKGADTLTGGTGNDTFTWSKVDVGTGVDHITDFSKGDRLSLHDLIKGEKFSNISDVVKLVDSAEGSHLWAKVGGSFQEIAVLDGVHHTTAADMLKAGMLLV